MRIGIIGSGNIGSSLGRLWAAAGHDVLFASRNPAKLTALVEKAGPNATAGTIEEAAAFGDVIMEAIPFLSIPDLPAATLAGKIVLSASNYYPSRDGDIDLGGKTHSQWVASHLPGAKLVKAFNMMRAGEIEQRASGVASPALAVLLATDHEDARKTAEQLVRDAKFEPVFVGTLADSAVFLATSAPLYDVRISAEEARSRLRELGV